jgi:hypothetical protein
MHVRRIFIRRALAGFTADRELEVIAAIIPHPAPKVILFDCSYYNLFDIREQGRLVITGRANRHPAKMTLIRKNR